MEFLAPFQAYAPDQDEIRFQINYRVEGGLSISCCDSLLALWVEDLYFLYDSNDNNFEIADQPVDRTTWLGALEEALDQIARKQFKLLRLPYFICLCSSGLSRLSLNPPSGIGCRPRRSLKYWSAVFMSTSLYR